ncbi:SRPBCC family protein [Streptomyces sp. AV19]|uniref:type II toxin-antitoxin system RatA family toxin n=1 Tax=Streptomyces sp. AV19 TaxID=2793068 RepID=UPI0018FEA051|nr:SRPBCC family protein [Streptomyces sp. AV19]MBH1933789.1 SRPBCC family protein [Streptomyces sp. AV19]MDG4535707.1 SRPBCC family protein [Streptomyces sp. AV19]
MRSVELKAHFDGVAPEDAYARIGDFARYPSLVTAIRRVTVHPATRPGRLHSDWEVDFRNGVLSWSEADSFDDERRVISFTQTTGDFETFTGEWEVRTEGDGCAVLFGAKFDFGLPSLAGIIDPVAERVLRETILSVLDGLLGAGSTSTGNVRAAG